ncbi:MAG: hypothetical protein WBC27_11355 [Candidatus Nanopelagicales bacterium]
MNWGDVATWAAIVVSATVGIAGLVIALKARSDTSRQADAAEHANRLAEESLDVARAAYALAEKQVPPSVRWNLTKGTGSSYTLTNDGAGTAYGVTVSHPGLHEDLSNVEQRALAPGQGFEFLVILTWGTGRDGLAVSWSTEPNGSTINAEYPLPSA